ncbi:non-specific lipid-transfer protein 2-like [Benincasa hispida]|uniref:non-specific lipid-transfer protein 2-like n=1 Tax=Benincasa hispida TaxID=102211 RepID=UPI0018FF49CC|nr:non-specific lipid-transfer protein 2-like [Benincasa hispida]
MKKVVSVRAVCLFIAAMAALLSVARVAEAVNCNPLELNSCAGAISSSSNPSRTCCSKLQEQKPCLCGYLRDPSLRPYVNAPGAKYVASKCGVPIPNC